MTLLEQKGNGRLARQYNDYFISRVIFSPSTAGLKKQWCSEVVELIEHMWAQEPQHRPDMTQVVESLEDMYAKY